MRHVMQHNQSRHGYSFDCNEKLLSLNDIKQTPLFKRYIDNICRNDTNMEKQFYNIVFDKQAIGVPYTNFLTGEQTYIDPRLCRKMFSSTGMAAGNSFEEAFNQGLSEIFERHCGFKIYENKAYTYYRIETNSLRNQELKNLVAAIEKKENATLAIYDLAYTFGMPVVMVILIDKENYLVSANYGAFPDFDIALYRCLSEIYQGRRCEKFLCNEPMTSMSQYEVCTTYSRNYKDYFRFPYEILTQYKTVECPSTVYISNEKPYNNHDLYNYYKQLCKDLQCNFYYYDTSMSDQMVALQIVSTDFIIAPAAINFYTMFNDDTMRKLMNQVAFRYDTGCALLDGTFDVDLFIFDFSQTQHNLLVETGSFLNTAVASLMGGDYLAHYNPYWSATFACLENLIVNNARNMQNLLTAINAYIPQYYAPLKKWLFLQLNKTLPTSQLSALASACNFNITTEEITNINNAKYNIQRYIIDNFYTETNSDTFKAFTQTLAKK